MAPGTGDTVARILYEPQQSKDVFDMGGVKKLQAAELHEGDIATGELDFERSTMGGRAEEHRLLFKEGSFLAGFEDPLDDVARLIGLVAHGDQARFGR